jgi:hypothetical protein
MITRHLAETQVVHAFDQVSFHSCTVSGLVCSCGAQDTGGALPFSYTGRLIDRLGLNRNFNAVVIAPSAYGALGASATACSIRYFGLSLGLQHAASTAGPFVDYSTADWPAETALQGVSTATSTGDPYYSVGNASISANNAALLTTGLTTSTSTGYATYVGQNSGAIPLTGAARFIRIIVAPHIEATGCASPPLLVSASLVFGQPDSAPGVTPLGRVAVTSACST